MAKRRDIEGKKGKHSKEGFDHSNELSRRRSRNIILLAVVVAVVIVAVLIALFLLVETPEDEDNEKEILTAEKTENRGYPTTAIGFSATIFNPDKEDDVFSTLIFALPPHWNYSIPQTISVEGKESKNLDFTVTPSVESALNGTYNFVLTITSGNTQQSYSLEYKITIFQANHGVLISAFNNSHDAEAGRSVSYSLLLENTGNGEDNMTLSYTQSNLPANWKVNFEYDTISIPGYEYKVVICTIDTHENTSKGRYDIKVRATSSKGFSSEVWLNTSLTKDFENRTVKEGDRLQVDYIGIYPEGDIFDTSVYDAANNTNLPKSPEWQMRSISQYKPLKIYVGDNDNDPEDDYVPVIIGFWEGTLDLKVNETKVVRFPSEKGYADGKWRLFEITIISIDNP